MSDQPDIGPIDPPRDFGPYELIEWLASGASVDVYRARTRGIEGFERNLSLRCLRNSADASQEVISDFIEHAKRSSALQHANIAQVLDLGKVDGVYYVAAEFIDGPALDTLAELAGGPLPPPLAVHIATKVLEALEYAHNRTDEAGHTLELLHSGIAPGDVAVSSDGQVKLLTFGASRAARSGPGSVGPTSGRIGYMSPEQVRGLPLDRRSDTFAVGVILHEMLTGRRLFSGDTEFEILEKIRKVEVTPPSLLNPAVPAGLEDLVIKALDRAPGERFQTANHMARELQKWAIGADEFLNDGDVRAFVGDVLPDLVTPAPAPAPPTPRSQPVPLPADAGLDWDDEEIETAIFARHDGMIPRRAPAPNPDEELGAWSADHATGVRRRSDSVSGLLPIGDTTDLGDLKQPPLASGDIPAVGILASPDTNTGFEPTVDEILRPDSGPEGAAPPTRSAEIEPAKSREQAPEPRQATPAAATVPRSNRAPASGDPLIRSSAEVPEVAGPGNGLLWMIALAAAVLIGLIVVLVRAPAESTSSIQLALTPADVEYTILIDGSVLHEGLVPTAISDVSAGRHEVTVRAEGYRERTEFVQVTPQGASLIEWQLERVPTVSVPIRTEPPGATVMIGGAELGTTPLEAELVIGDMVEIELALIGHEPHSHELIVTQPASGVRIALTQLDEPASVELPIVSVPEGANYTITRHPGGEMVATGRTPAAATLEVGGNFRVTLDAEGYEGAIVPLVATPTGFEPLSVDLRPIEDVEGDSDESDSVEGDSDESDSDETDGDGDSPNTAANAEAPTAQPRDEDQREEAAEREEQAERAAAAEREEEAAREAAAREAERERAIEAQREAAPERPALPEPEEEAAPEAGPPGFINVRSTPPASIVIDGTDTGLTTPADGIPLSSGVRHRVELVNDAAGLHRTYRISLDPGQVRNIVNRSN